jgi:hypothetical protein
MAQRFLFHRIDVGGGGLGVDVGLELPVPVLPHSAKTEIGIGDPAVMAAEKTARIFPPRGRLNKASRITGVPFPFSAPGLSSGPAQIGSRASEAERRAASRSEIRGKKRHKG